MTDVSTLTTKQIDGDGVFDKFMCAITLHIEKQFNDGKISSNDYATVYLGAIQTAISQSIQFLATQATIELTKKQTEIAEQTKLKTIKEVEVLEQQRLTAIEEVQNMIKNRELISKQIIKINSEIDLLSKKSATETAQIDGSNVSDASVIGRQMTLYKNQAEGYIRDAEQKVTKLLVDTWAVRRTTDEGTTANFDNHLDDFTIGNAVDKLVTGINSNTGNADSIPSPVVPSGI